MAPPAPTPQELAARKRAREAQAINRVLGYTTFISGGTGRKREVALTFDDGPSQYTDEILAILRRSKIHATFFVVGSVVPDHESVLRRVVKEGHVIGNHTQNHPAMGDLDPASQIKEIQDQENAVTAAGAKEWRLFRPPYRSFDETTLEILAERKLLMVLWDVDTSDYASPDPDSIVQSVLNDVKPGSIILMHDGGGDRASTVAALPGIIAGLKQRNLKPVTIPELVRNDPPPRDQGMPEGTQPG